MSRRVIALVAAAGQGTRLGAPIPKAYVELDGEARKNPVAILKIVKVMQDEGIGYGSINHPIDTCRKCGHRGVIYSKCPVCGSDDILRMRRITGYLTGSLESWNSAKQAEERDRVKHR